jgi:hypothetical protein
MTIEYLGNKIFCVEIDGTEYLSKGIYDTSDALERLGYSWKAVTKAALKSFHDYLKKEHK